MRYVLPILLTLLGACTSSNQNGSSSQEARLDTLSQYGDGSPKKVVLQKRDSVLERRTYRPTGTLREITRAGSTETYFDLHDPDSAAILKDYLQGRWRNLSADTSRDQSSAYYIFESDRLTFENPARAPLESLRVSYKDGRTLLTGEGMSVRPEITSFDTVQVTGYTLVRVAADSL